MVSRVSESARRFFCSGVRASSGVKAAPTQDGDYRFVGVADDILAVAVDKRTVLDGSLFAVADQHDGLLGAAESSGSVQCNVDDLLRADHRPASTRVLSTLTPRNSADGQPWLTAAT